MSRNVLITGGAGFIGSHLADRLLKLGDRVVNIDNFDPFYHRSIKEQNINAHRNNSDYHLIEGDIRNLDEISSGIPDDIDVIVHLAAKAGVRPSIKDPVEYQRVNVMGTQNLLEFARERGIRSFIFASSSSVYGTNENVPWSENDHVLKPISPYASTKVSGELMGHVYSELYDIRFVALRFFTVYGPRQRPDLAIHKFLRLMKNEEEITLYGDGSSRRDYTYIDDILKGILAAMEYRKSMYEIINLGNERTVNLLELVKAIESASGIKARKKFGPEQPGDVEQTWADISKAEKLLDYNPEYDLAKGLSQFAEWYENNQINSI